MIHEFASSSNDEEPCITQPGGSLEPNLGTDMLQTKVHASASSLHDEEPCITLPVGSLEPNFGTDMLQPKIHGANRMTSGWLCEARAALTPPPEERRSVATRQEQRWAAARSSRPRLGELLAVMPSYLDDLSVWSLGLGCGDR